MAADAELEVILTPGPRRAWDVGRQGDSEEYTGETLKPLKEVRDEVIVNIQRSRIL